ncbi:hypothetical protein BC831DRAFT_309111 [Entophlyctis helioformis]|nr:hypothetical protein BC831DRAFT_309111 [Entophlyctis helioformis]
MGPDGEISDAQPVETRRWGDGAMERRRSVETAGELKVGEVDDAHADAGILGRRRRRRRRRHGSRRGCGLDAGGRAGGDGGSHRRGAVVAEGKEVDVGDHCESVCERECVRECESARPRAGRRVDECVSVCDGKKKVGKWPPLLYPLDRGGIWQRSRGDQGGRRACRSVPQRAEVAVKAQHRMDEFLWALRRLCA